MFHVNLFNMYIEYVMPEKLGDWTEELKIGEGGISLIINVMRMI